MARLFVEADLAGGSKRLERGAAHYLRHVMRAPTAPLLLFNGATANGARHWRCAARRRQWRWSGTARASRRSSPTFGSASRRSACAHRLRRRERRAWRRGVAAGLTEHTIVERVNTERLRANAIEAAEQTERLTVPDVRLAVDLMKLLGDWRRAGDC